MPTKRPIVLIIRDGWGFSKSKKGNAIAAANLPNTKHYETTYPTTLLQASGNAVGLPEKTQGGSEVGHLTMGAGQIIWQPLELINRAIRNKKFEKNKVLLEAMYKCKKNKRKLHITGLLSDQGVHATTEHLFALLKLAKKENMWQVYLHLILDGRDVPEKSAVSHLRQLQKQIKQIGIGKIATIVGRYYAMDRDNNLDRTAKAFALLTKAEGRNEKDPEQAIKHAYKRGDATDYYVKPIIITEDQKPVAIIEDKDTLIFYNFRTDRVRQLTRMFINQKPRVNVICFTEYNPLFKIPVAFPQTKVQHNLGKVLASHGLTQLRIAETEKYAHVTYFFNSQVEKPEKGEDRILVPSPKVPSYAEQPAMSAREITTELLKKLKTQTYDFILINFANADLVGHSGDLVATKKCCEVVDECIGKIVPLILKQEGVVLLAGDHGNAEQMLYPSGERCPAHTINPIPFTLISKDPALKSAALCSNAGLIDIAPTVLDLQGIRKPKEMTGETILLKHVVKYTVKHKKK